MYKKFIYIKKMKNKKIKYTKIYCINKYRVWFSKYLCQYLSQNLSRLFDRDINI